MAEARSGTAVQTATALCLFLATFFSGLDAGTEMALFRQNIVRSHAVRVRLERHPISHKDTYSRGYYQGFYDGFGEQEFFRSKP